MKKGIVALLFSTLLFLMGSLSTRAAYSVSSLDGSTKIPEYLKAENFIRMSASEFQRATGHKLNLFQKMYFKKLQRNLSRSQITPGTTILPYYDVQKGKFKIDGLWFVLGCIIGPFAILFSYTSKQPKYKRISALIGFPIWVLWFGWLFIF